jgi:hypothetical protein
MIVLILSHEMCNLAFSYCVARNGEIRSMVQDEDSFVIDR